MGTHNEEIYVSYIADVDFVGTSYSQKKGFIYFGDDPSRLSVTITLFLPHNVTDKDQKKWTELFQKAKANIIIGKRFKGVASNERIK